MIFRFLTIFCLIAYTFVLNAQKIKYKDLFPILDAKNYAEGKPQLITFLADEKNADDANPNLQMGIMLEHFFLSYDIIDDSSKIYSSGDSSVFYLEKAKSLIDEKELKKRDEYYQAFFRRDLRTGEFGIKVSDVHLDIEKKIEAIRLRIENVKAINKSLNAVADTYSQAQDKFKIVSQAYSDFNTLLLSATASEMTLLDEIQSLGASAVEEAKNIGTLARNLNSEKYQNEIVINEIVIFGTDGLSSADLMNGSIVLWDYETWARETLSEIRGGVGLFKTMILNYSSEIRSKRSKLKKSQNAENLEVPDELLETFTKYDPQSTAEKLLMIETFESRVIKNVDLQLNPDLMDSTKIGSQLSLYSKAKENVDELYDLVNSVNIEGIADAKKKYAAYIDSFFKTSGTAGKYVDNIKEWSARNKEWIDNAVDYWTERNKWGIIAKEGEEERKIALFQTDSLYGDFKMLTVNKFTIPQVVIYGVDINSKMGVVGSFGEDRIQQWSLEFDLPVSDGYLYTTDTIPSLEGSTSFFVYNEKVDENNLAVVCYTDSGTKEWSVLVTVPKRPVDFKFDDLTQELTILMYPEEQLPLDSDELGYIVIDRTGNVR